MFKKFFFILICFSLFNLIIAENTEIPIIKEIKIQGIKNEKDKKLVLEIIKTKTGEVFDEKKIEKDIKAIWELDLFKNIKIDFDENYVLIYILEEKEKVKEIKIVGNKKIKESTIREKINITLNTPLNKKKLKENISKINSLYEEKGYLLSEIKEKLDFDSKENKVSIILQITEGEKVKIKNIDIIENKVFNDKKILKIIETKKTGFFTSGVFQKNIFEKDLIKIIDFYKNNGYPKAKIISHQIFYNKNKTEIFITIKIEEGNFYKIGKIKIEGNKIFSTSTLLKAIKTKPYEPYNFTKTEMDRYSIYEIYSEKGYLGCEITPNFIYDEENKKINIVYSIVENEIYSVEDIIIRGNNFTKEKVIRRELVIKPGDILNRSKVLDSQKKITQLGFFNKVVPLTEPGIKKGTMDLIFEVEERESGSAQLGMTYSAEEKLVGFVEVAHANFLGRGQKIYVRYEFGAKKAQGEIGFTEPWLFDKPIYSNFRLYNLLKDYSFIDTVYGQQKISGTAKYKTDQKGFETTLGYRFWNFHNFYLTCEYQKIDYCLIKIIKPTEPTKEKYKDENDYNKQIDAYKNSINMFFNKENNPFNVDDDHTYYHPGISVAKEFMTNNQIDPNKVAKSKQTRESRTISGSYVWNQYDDPINTNNGFKINFYSKLAGLGGDEYFIKNSFNYGHYFAFPLGLVLGHHIAFSIAKGYNGYDVPVIERYSVGGASTVRGYGERGIVNNCRSQFIVNIELKRTFENFLTPAIFVDFGNGWSYPSILENQIIDKVPVVWNDILKEIELDKLKGNYGFGIRLLTPMGIIRCDIAKSFEKKNWVTHFTIGPIF